MQNFLTEITQENQAFLKAIKKPSRDAKSEIDFQRDETIVVWQHEYALTCSSSKMPVLGTFAAGPCIILGIYDRKNRLALLAHLDVNADVHSLQPAIDELSKENCVAHLYGGKSDDFLSSEEAASIVDFLRANHISIESADILRKEIGESGASLAIDARTGAIYTPVGMVNLFIGHKEMARYQHYLNSAEVFHNGLKVEVLQAQSSEQQLKEFFQQYRTPLSRIFYDKKTSIWQSVSGFWYNKSTCGNQEASENNNQRYSCAIS